MLFPPKLYTEWSIRNIFQEIIQVKFLIIASLPILDSYVLRHKYYGRFILCFHEDTWYYTDVVHLFSAIFICRILRGSGQVVDGDKGVVYTHKDLNSWSCVLLVKHPLHQRQSKGIGLSFIFCLWRDGLKILQSYLVAKFMLYCYYLSL